MALLFSPFTTQALTVKVSQIDTARQGQIMVMLFAKDGFPKDHSSALSIQTAPVTAGANSMLFHFPQSPGEFAIKVLHDEDMNNQVTKNWTGVWPAEGLGFSNGARVRLTGAPSFKEARLTLSSPPDVINISVIYP
ncbi:DUF2141 domain-containing protein [Bowmanella sp. Y26]|uniref:DUF2141 domain-containing protein n=1 Tax=Bowmanella yangjiangensis TaxID=2811230 RepID=UPI001BDD374A|nr:DUF2141 domain-containing protein [Bowmanella yangjiangensis]MBT1063213.1 DUF2141 domain-containing protein [Bowmanella yangjiangensis]